MSQRPQIQLLKVKEWLSQETVSLIGPLQDKATSIMKEVKERIDDTTQSSQRILENSEKEMAKSSPKTYRFARNANKFAQNLIQAVETVTAPDDFNYEKLHTLCGDLEKTAASLEQMRRGAYPYISPYFIFDRRRLDVSLKRLFDITKELRTFVTTKYATAKTIEDTYSVADKLVQTISETKQNQENIKLTEGKERNLKGEIAKTQQKIANVKAEVELSELVTVNQRIEELRAKVKHNLRYLQKPFFKLQSLARTSKVVIPLDELNKLGDYLNDPFVALATEDNGYSTLRSILKKLDAAIAQNKLKLKSTRLRKAQDQISSILGKDSLSQLQTDCKEALSQRRQLLSSGTVTALQSQLEHLQNELKELQKENEFVRSKSKLQENEHAKLQEKIESLRKELEENIFQLTDKNVQIALAA